MTFEFDLIKNDLLKKERYISFIDVIKVIEKQGVLADIENPNL